MSALSIGFDTIIVGALALHGIHFADHCRRRLVRALATQIEARKHNKL